MNRFAVLAIAILWTVGCSRPHRTATSRAIADAVEYQTTEINIADLSNKKWDRLHVFSPYNGEETIARELGYAWNDYGKSGINLSDGIALLIFTQDGQIVEWFDHPRRHGDFALVSRPGGYSREEANFIMERTGVEMWPRIRNRE